MTEPEAREIAERICDEMEDDYNKGWTLCPVTRIAVERVDWIDKITAALVEASKGDQA